MCKSAWKMAKVNLKRLRVPYVVTGIVAGAVLAQTFVFVVLAFAGVGTADNSAVVSSVVSAGNLLWLLPLFAGIFIAGKNFRRIINLGGKRGNFFWGSLAAHAMLAFIVSLANVVIFYTLDRALINMGIFDPSFFGGVANLIEVFGWNQHGPIVAFLRQFAFLFLLATFAHTFAAIQDKWFGWVTSVALVAIVSVFTPIAPLRAALAWFFNLILTHRLPFMQILACVALGLAVYALNKPILARKAV